MANLAPFLHRQVGRALLVFAAIAGPWAAGATELQNPVDRADAAVVERELDDREAAPPTLTSPAIVDNGNARGNAVTPGEGFIVGAIRVDGSAALPPEAFAAAIEPYLGRELDADALRALARDVATVARNAGFGLATAWIPQQDVVNGILRVRIDEGRIDAVEVDGPAGTLVEARLRPLADGTPVRTAELERRLRLAGDLAGVSVGQARLVRRGGRSILAVSTGYDRARGRVWMDNWGTSSVGPVRLRFAADLNGVAAAGDRLSLGGVVTPLQPRELQLVSGGYSVPVGTSGTELQLRGYLSGTQAGAWLREYDLDGMSHEIAIGATHPLLRSRDASLWAIFDLAVRDSELTRRDVLIRDDRVVAAGAGLYGAGRVAGGFARVRLSLVQGLDALGATEAGDPLASRRDASGRFTKISFWADYSRNLGGDFSLYLEGEGQLASRPLLSSEEMGLGGQSLLRGYDYRELAGERGAAAGAELRFDLNNLPRPLRRAQLYAFADAGRVTNLRGGFGGGTLAAAGAGVRVWAEKGLEGSLELGLPLRDGASGRDVDPRISFTLGIRF